MSPVPRTATVLGAAGLLPFLLGLLAALVPDPGALPLMADLPVALRSDALLVSWGQIILAFMAGALWGFAARATGRRAALGLTASVMPALWVFFATGRGNEADLAVLALGFAALLPLDWAFRRAGLAPAWWLRLRLPLTAVVLACLALPLIV